MTHRIDDYLDGALDRIALTPDERAEADALERAIEETRTFVDGKPVPDLTADIMRRVRTVDRPEPRRTPMFARLVRVLWGPREIYFEFRPAYAIAGAIAVALLVIFTPSLRQSLPNARMPARNDDAPKLLVQFRLQASDASTVRLAGSFTNWQPQYDLHQTAPGVWTVTLPLPQGVHDYAFVIDGQRWVPDPYAQSVDDGFGGTNSRIAILPPDHSRS